MLNPRRLMIGIACSSAIMLNACSHEWENLSPLGSTASGSSSGASSGGGSGGEASTSSSSGGGTGGSGNECAPSSPACGTLIGTFDDQMQFEADWYLQGKPGQVTAVGGVAHLAIGSGDSSTFAATNADFTFQACAVWVEIVEADTANDVMVRLSLANPSSSSRFTLGVLAQNLVAYSGEVSLFSVPYDMNAMRFVRLREEAGQVHFGYSADAKCWKEYGDVLNTLMGAVEARIAVTHFPAGSGSAGDGKFDNYCGALP
jgi:hypothetical protein